MQRFKFLISSRVGERKAGQGVIEFSLILGSISVAAFVFLFALAPRLTAIIR